MTPVYPAGAGGRRNGQGHGNDCANVTTDFGPDGKWQFTFYSTNSLSVKSLELSDPAQFFLASRARFASK
jgi:hypothetical protein